MSGILHAQRQGKRAHASCFEGLMYQLLGHGLNQRQQPCPSRPGTCASLNACGACWNSLLNGIILCAAGSPGCNELSSLRKFRQRYGCTLFDYLRNCRLAAGAPLSAGRPQRAAGGVDVRVSACHQLRHRVSSSLRDFTG